MEDSLPEAGVLSIIPYLFGSFAVNKDDVNVQGVPVRMTEFRILDSSQDLLIPETTLAKTGNAFSSRRKSRSNVILSTP